MLEQQGRPWWQTTECEQAQLQWMDRQQLASTIDCHNRLPLGLLALAMTTHAQQQQMLLYYFYVKQTQLLAHKL